MNIRRLIIDFFEYYMFGVTLGVTGKKVSHLWWCSKSETEYEHHHFLLPQEFALVKGFKSTDWGANIESRQRLWDSAINVWICSNAKPQMHDSYSLILCRFQEHYCQIIWDVLNGEEEKVVRHESFVLDLNIQHYNYSKCNWIFLKWCHFIMHNVLFFSYVYFIWMFAHLEVWNQPQVEGIKDLLKKRKSKYPTFLSNLYIW